MPRACLNSSSLTAPGASIYTHHDQTGLSSLSFFSLAYLVTEDQERNLAELLDREERVKLGLSTESGF
jgi:hypothetical protein